VFPDLYIAGISFTTHSSYGVEPLQQNENENINHLSIPMISPPPSSVNLPSLADAHAQISNVSTKNLQQIQKATSPQTALSTLSWRELIIFGIKRCGNTRESSLLNITTESTTSELKSNQASSSFVDESTLPAYCAQLLLLKPLSLHEYFLEAEDTIEMRNVNLKQLHRFTLCSLPLDDIYFILSPREAIEVFL
jgi:hypothetical protein